MSRYVFDTETNGLLPDLTTIHSLVFKNIDTGEVWSCHKDFYKTLNPGKMRASIEDGLRELMEAELIVGHNIIDFDIPALQKVYPWFKPKGLVRDTLVLSRLIRADSQDHNARDWKLVKIGKMPKKMIGRHSLESWGYRLGVWKGDYSEIKTAEAKALGITDAKAILRFVWGVWNVEMQEYCEQDVEVTLALWLYFVERLARGWSDETVDLEHETAWVIARQYRYGVGFDEAKAGKLYAKLVAHQERLLKELQAVFPPKKIEWVPKANNKRYGYKKGVPVVEEVEFNPGSRQQVADRLTEKYGWEPTEYGKDGVPTVNDEILSQLPWPEAKVLTEYFVVDKRIGSLATGKQAYMRHVENGVIHPPVISNGAVTGRMTHRIVVNVPGEIDKKTGKPQLYGKEFRELFIPQMDVFVGCDADSLEGRVMGGYMARYDDGAYSQSVISGNKAEGTDNHSRTRDAINAGLKKLGISIHRETTKTVFYALIYGAKDPKLGESAGINGPKRKTIGAAIRSAVMKGIPGLGKLVELLTRKVRLQGWIKGLDGRKLRIRKEDAALNTLFQSAGAILMKRALIILDTELSGVKPSVIGTQGAEAATKLVPGRDYEYALNYHDEWQIDARNEFAKEIGTAAEKAIVAAGDYYHFRCPLKGNSAIGPNWASTH